MCNIIIIAILMVTVTAGNASIEDIMGEWTPVALYPSIFVPFCLKMRYSIVSDKPQCECADGKKTDYIETKGTGYLKDTEPVYGPMLFIEDANEVASSLNVNCTCGGQKFQYRTVAKSLNDNYMVLYKTQNITKNDPNAATIYARKAPPFLELMEFMKNLKELSDRQGGIMCSSEYEAAQQLAEQKQKLTKNA